MLLIPCPRCGLREESEFTYGGPRRDLPALAGQADAAVWSKALHMGHNPRGALRELWYHGSGCEAWIEVTRDTVSHEFHPGGAE